MQGRLPMIMNVAAGSLAGIKTVMRMQSRDEPAIAHFVGGEAKPWLIMVQKFQGQKARLPAGIARLSDAWDALYWLAKTNKVCDGSLTADEKAEMRVLLEQV